VSAKIVPTFADRGVSHGQCCGSPTAVISVSSPDETVRDVYYHKQVHSPFPSGCDCFLVVSECQVITVGGALGEEYQWNN
jgi:hypothetical protein